MKTFLMVFAGIFIGNYMGDQATFRDCATTGRAVMYSGGAVECKVEAL